MVAYIGVFPGQGAQFPLMGLDLYEIYKSVKDLFTLASDITHVDLYKMLHSGSSEDLQQTHNTQVLITLINRACSIVLHQMNIAPLAVSGFSLGELSAYKEASILSDESLFSLVWDRGTIMARHAMIVQRELGNIGMAAVIGLPFEQVDAIIKESGINHLYAANDNSATQVVVSGLFSALSEVEPLLKEKGAKRIIPLKVSGPFHTPLMIEAKKEFEEIIQKHSFYMPKIAVYSNVHAKKIQSTAEAKELLAQQLISPVRWSAIVKEIEVLYPTIKAIEVGPNTVLTGLFRSTQVTCYPSGSVEYMEKIEKEVINE